MVPRQKWPGDELCYCDVNHELYSTTSDYIMVLQFHHTCTCKMSRNLALNSTSLSPILMYLPFLMVSLPRRGSKTGSTDSPMLSSSRTSPLLTACSIESR